MEVIVIVTSKEENRFIMKGREHIFFNLPNVIQVTPYLELESQSISVMDSR